MKLQENYITEGLKPNQELIIEGFYFWVEESICYSVDRLFL